MREIIVHGLHVETAQIYVIVLTEPLKCYTLNHYTTTLQTIPKLRNGLKG